MAGNPIQAEPSAPAAGDIQAAPSRVARKRLLTRDSSARPSWMLESPASVTLRMILPDAGSAGVKTLGAATTPNQAGTLAAYNGGTDYVASQCAVKYTSATSANAEAGLRDAGVGTSIWRGNAAGLGGFDCHIRFVLEAISAAGRVFVGLSDQQGNVHVAGDPSASAGDFIGICSDAADSNLFIGSKDGTTYRDQVDLGANTKLAATLYDLWMYAEPNGSGIYVTVDKWLASTRTRLVDNALYTLDLPRALTINLRPHVHVGAAATGVAQVIRFCSYVCTTPR